MAKEFIITEGDIDSVVDSLLAEAPVLNPAWENWLQGKIRALERAIAADDHAEIGDIWARVKATIRATAAGPSPLSDEQRKEIISRIELLFPRFGEKADIDVHDWASAKAKGGVSVLDGFKYKGSLKNTTAAKFIEMYINNKIATAMIDKLATQADFEINEAMYDKESFFKDFILPRDDSEWDDLIHTVETIGEGEAGDEEKENEAKDVFENLANVLKDKKEVLDKNPNLAKKFNTVREDYYTEMSVLFKKKYAEYITENPPAPPAPIPESLQEGYLHSITIDFSEIRRKQKHLDESFLVMFGAWVKWLLEKMFGGGSIPGTIKGSKSEVESFARAMGSEKRYIETAKRYGLDHPTTYKNKAKLSSATKSFEKETGIKWPFE